MGTSTDTTARQGFATPRHMRQRPSAREAPPKARLFGGSRPRGGQPPTTGHAGRMGLARGLMAAVALALAWLAIALLPTPAAALSEAMAFYKNPVDYTMSVASYRSAEGDVAYCCNKSLTHENGLVYTRSAYATGRWGYVAYHGYPTTTVIEGYSLSVGRARSATQWAVWMLNGDDVESDPYFSGAAADMRAAAYALRNAALAYERSGVDGPENHYARLYYPPSGSSSLQTFLAVPSAAPAEGSVEVRKVSTLPSVTAGNGCYSLEGAVFELFSDETCTTCVGEATTDADGVATFDSLAAGTYWVREKTAPAGFVLDAAAHKVEASEPAGVVEVADVPQLYRTGLLVRKVDATTGEATGQGDASLEGAEFTVSHYAPAPAGSELRSSAPDAIWVVATDASGEAWLDEEHLVGGDPLPLAPDGTVALPLGTLVIEETEPPKGYLPYDERIEVELGASGDEALIDLPAATVVAEQVERGGIRLAKVDRETGEATPLGMARLEGAVFTVENASASPVVVDGASFEPGEVVTTLTTGRDGTAETTSGLLPFGTYVIRESEAPEGYVLDTAWSRTVSVDAEGSIADVFSAGNAVADQVKRGDVCFNKVDGLTMARLPGVAFRLTLLEDAYGERIGESHIIVTDENGSFDSAAATNPHTSSTNANDEAVSAEGRVDGSRLAPDAGVWFSGKNTLSTSPDDGLGALPYGTYLLEELRSDANEGHSLVRITFTVRGHGRTCDLGTIDDSPLGIQTTLEAEDGSELVGADGMVTLVDVVDYHGLTPGEEYVMRGALHVRGADGNDRGVLASPDGVEVAAEVSFVPDAPEGSVSVTFEFDATGLEGSSVVAFEECLENEVVVARHEDIASESQTVRFAGIATTATDAEDGDHIIAPNERATIVDSVAYQGLVPGETYTLVGTLHVRDAEGQDQGVLFDKDGDAVSASVEFVPQEESGSVEVTFELDASELEDCALVVFERLYAEGELRAAHEDIADEGQTVYVSERPAVPSAPEGPTPSKPIPSTGDATVRTKPLFVFLAGLIALCGSAGAWALEQARERLEHGAHMGQRRASLGGGI